MTRTEAIIYQFVWRHGRRLLMRSPADLKLVCECYMDFPGTTPEYAVQTAYYCAREFCACFLPHLTGNSALMMQYHVAGLLLRCAGLYSTCEQLHHETGLSIIQPEPVQA